MGVKNLTNYIKNAAKLDDEKQLQNCMIIIDGNNIEFEIWKNALYAIKENESNVSSGSRRLSPQRHFASGSGSRSHHDSVSGHESYSDSRSVCSQTSSSSNQSANYSILYAEYKKFVTTLRACRIEPFVVFDGCKTELKQSIDKQRESKAHIKNIPPPPPPLLLHRVFVDVLQECNVKAFSAIYEADPEIVKLANEWQSPVLSSDSDFYIFNLDYGFIHYESFEWNDLQVNKNKSIKCKIYSIANFPKLTTNQMPVFASILDTESSIIEFRDIKYDAKEEDNKKYESLGNNPNYIQKFKRIDKMINWLQDKSEEQVFDYLRKELNSLLKEEQINENLENIKLRIKYYLIEDDKIEDDTYLSQFFKNDVLELNQQFIDKINAIKEKQKYAKTKLQHDLHSRLLLNCIKLKLPRFILELILRGIHLLHNQLEYEKLPSSYENTEHLRKIIYGFLFSPEIIEIHVIDRNKNQISPTYYLSNDEILPNLLQLQEYANNRLNAKKLIYKILNINKNEFKLRDLKLAKSQTGVILYYIMMIIYWYSSNDPVPQEFFYALIGSIICFRIKTAKSEDSLENYLSLLTKNKSKWKHVFNHYYSQFQACIEFMLTINSLLGEPFVDAKIYHYLDVKFLYKTTNKLCSSDDPRINCEIFEYLEEGNYSMFMKLEKIILDAVGEKTDKNKMMRLNDVLNAMSKKQESVKTAENKISRLASELISKFSSLTLDDSS